MSYSRINSGPKSTSVLIVILGLLVVSLQPAFSSTSTATKAPSSVKPVPAPPTSGVSGKSPVLRMGSKGESVKVLQNALKSKGFFQGAADGFFGNQTQASVMKFQTSKKLVADGVVGPTTWAALR